MKPETITTSPKRRDMFLASVFFVLGFSTVFSLLGVLLQTIFSNVAYAVQIWLGRIGGVIIILFGLYLLGLLKLDFLSKEKRLRITHKFRSIYTGSFVFGAAFAVGWTPCVSAALGAILALAATAPSSGFFLMLSYTLGLGMPFLAVGLFTHHAQRLINRAGRWLYYFQYFFGAILLALGVLIFTNQLVRIASFELIVDLLSIFKINVGGGDIMSFNLVNLGVAFVAGIASFLSPCVLPIIPGFLSYLATAAVRREEE